VLAVVKGAVSRSLTAGNSPSCSASYSFIWRSPVEAEWSADELLARKLSQRCKDAEDQLARRCGRVDCGTLAAGTGFEMSSAVTSADSKRHR